MGCAIFLETGCVISSPPCFVGRYRHWQRFKLLPGPLSKFDQILANPFRKNLVAAKGKLLLDGGIAPPCSGNNLRLFTGHKIINPIFDILQGTTLVVFLPNRTFHLKLDQAVHFHRVLHWQFFDQRLDKPGYHHGGCFFFGQTAAHQVKQLLLAHLGD